MFERSVHRFEDFLKAGELKPGVLVYHLQQGWFRFLKVQGDGQVLCVKQHILVKKIFKMEALVIYTIDFKSRINFETEKDNCNKQRSKHDLHHAEKSAEG